MKTTLSALALFALAAAAAAQPLPSKAKPNGGCVAVVASSEQTGGTYQSTFSATKVIDVDFSILFTPGAMNRFAGSHTVEFRLFTPAGNLYQSMTIPFSADASKAGKKQAVDRYPSPQPVQLLTDTTYANAKHVRVSSRLPVAGTPIVSNSLYGQWRAEVFVDDDTVPCAVPALFTITQ